MSDAETIDPKLLAELRALAERTGRDVASLLGEAVEAYLARARVRPEFKAAAEQVMDENAELLRRLAR